MCVCVSEGVCVRAGGGAGSVGVGGPGRDTQRRPQKRNSAPGPLHKRASSAATPRTSCTRGAGGDGEGLLRGVDGAKKKDRVCRMPTKTKNTPAFSLSCPSPPLLSHTPCLSWRPPAPPPTPSRGWTSSELAGFLFFEWTEWKSSPVARHTRHAHPADATCEPPRGGRRWGEGAAPAGASTQGFPINPARHRVSTYPLSPSAAPAPSTRSPTRRTSSKRCAARWRQTT